jgi:cyclohexa-1,5-dienecarbonyl-CoA hydratase
MSLVRFETRGSVGVITLDRPPVNALSGQLVADLAEAVTSAAAPGVRAVLVTGAPHFAAGADIAGFKVLMDAGGSGADLGVQLGATLARLEALPKPVIAAVRGFALGGGLELAMACDLRMLAEGAKVGQPEIKLGVIPGAGGTQRLPRLVGMGRARDLIYTGRMVDAAEAHRIGLADRVVPDADLEAAALAWAEELAGGATAAIAVAKRVIASGWDRPLAEGLALEVDGFREVFATADAVEGVHAFLEKRAPRFSGS